MKILISDDGGGAHFFERLGLAKAFAYCGFQVKLWNIKQEAAFDVFNNFEPDIFIGQTYNIDRATYKCICDRPALRVVLKSGDWGNFTDNWTREQKEKYPILIESQKVKNLILKLKDETGKPNALFIHYHKDYIEQTHGNWIKAGIPVFSLMNGADLFQFTNGKWKEEFVSDIVFVGGMWPYKSKTLIPYLYPLCNPTLNLKIKIFGNQNWSIPQYCGYAPDNQIANIMKSAAICPNISEPHSQDFGFDIIERPYKILSNKCFCISDKIEGLQKLFPDGIIFADNPQDFLEKIQYFLKNPQEKMKYIQKGYWETIHNHSYFDRGATIFWKLDMKYESMVMVSGRGNFILENNLV